MGRLYNWVEGSEFWWTREEWQRLPRLYAALTPVRQQPGLDKTVEAASSRRAEPVPSRPCLIH